jgi:hypothetical protein
MLPITKFVLFPEGTLVALVQYVIVIKVRVMVFNTTFNNISAISWQSVLLVEETGVHGENHRPVAVPGGD